MSGFKCDKCRAIKGRCWECIKLAKQAEFERPQQMTILPSPDLPTTSIEHGDPRLGTGFRINEPFVPAPEARAVRS